MIRSGLSLAIVLTLWLALTACTASATRPGSVEQDIARIYSDYSPQIRQFFIDEAVKAGVKGVRELKPSDVRPPVNPNEIPGCAYASLTRKLILIEVEQPRCTKLDHLAHEIAHIGSNCAGHNKIFYAYNYGIARRYEEQFSDAISRRWYAPIQSVASVEAIYKSKGC